MQWQNANDDVVKKLPFHIAEWLLEFGSLTEKLEQTIQQKVQLQVISESYCQASREEAELLGVTVNDKLWSREVILYGKTQPWIYAKTLVPSRNANLIKTLGVKPLGSILFSEKQLSRQFLKVGELTKNDELYQSAGSELSQGQEILWARRSLWQNLEHKDKELLVSEVFLPDSPLYTV